MNYTSDYRLSLSPAPHGITRRHFIRATVASSVALSTAPLLRGAEGQQSIPQRKLGRTGLKVSILGLGGYHIGTVASEAEAIRLIRSAIDQGITFMDNCWDYNEGRSEIWMGNALKDGYRDRVVLMTKIDGQTKTSAAKQIDESLKRLQTDRVDIMQFHEVIRPTDPERIFGKGGAIEAIKEAQAAGKIRFVGFTGHKDPKIHLKMVEVGKQNGFRFDAVQMPLNVMDAHYRSFEKEVLPVLVRDQIGVLAMKSMGAGHLLESGVVKPGECLHYALSLPVSTVITGIDKPEILKQAVEAGKSFKPLSEAQMTALRERTSQVAKEGKFEPFKNTTNFDGTVQNPHWLG